MGFPQRRLIGIQRLGQPLWRLRLGVQIFECPGLGQPWRWWWLGRRRISWRWWGGRPSLGLEIEAKAARETRAVGGRMFDLVRNRASLALRFLVLVLGGATLLSVWACNKKEQLSAQNSPKTFASPDDAGKGLFEAAKSGNLWPRG
jgi:hypothetical protein